MKSLFITMAALSSSLTFAAPVYCGQAGGEYQVTLSNNHKLARVDVDGKLGQFGNLVCSVPGRAASDEEVVLTCRSKGVADAGYNVIFNLTDVSLTATVEEITFLGSKTVATLPCVEAQN